MMAFDPARGQVIRQALDGGINFFDTTFFEEVQSLGHVIAQFGCRIK